MCIPTPYELQFFDIDNKNLYRNEFSQKKNVTSAAAVLLQSCLVCSACSLQEAESAWPSTAMFHLEAPLLEAPRVERCTGCGNLMRESCKQSAFCLCRCH